MDTGRTLSKKTLEGDYVCSGLINTLVTSGYEFQEGSKPKQDRLSTIDIKVYRFRQHKSSFVSRPLGFHYIFGCPLSVKESKDMRLHYVVLLL
jgi:hypothetical protein